MEFIDTLLFGIYPYVAVAIFLLGSLIRYDREQYSWKTGSSQMLSSKGFRIGNILFHVGIITILLGHFGGLVVPYEIWHALGVTLAAKQIIAMGVGGFFGVLCFIGMTILVKRRLFDPRIKATSTTMDTGILLLIYFQLILGMLSILVSFGHMDGSVMAQLMNWSRYLLTFRPVESVEYISSVHWIYKAHVTLGFTLLVLFPFSRLVHVWSVPVQYFRRNYQVVRQKP
jgi:nitrate reductase gamma subunit